MTTIRSSKSLLFVLCTVAACSTFAGCGDDDDSATPTNMGGGAGKGNASQAGDGGKADDVNQAGGAGSQGEAGHLGQGGNVGAGGEVGQGGVVGAGGEANMGDAGAGGAGPLLMCTQLKYGAGTTATYVTAAKPAALGGEIVDGTYQLTKLTHYASQTASTGNDVIHSAVKLAGSTLEWANQGKDEPETRGSFTYTINDTELALTKVCPAAGAGDGTPYTTKPNTFIIYLDAEYTYTKQ